MKEMAQKESPRSLREDRHAVLEVLPPAREELPARQVGCALDQELPAHSVVIVLAQLRAVGAPARPDTNGELLRGGQEGLSW